MSAGEHRKFEVTVQVSCHQGTKTPRETFEKRPLLSPAIGGMSDSNFNPQNTQCIPPVKIFVFLELESRFSGKHFSKVSKIIEYYCSTIFLQYILFFQIRV